MTMQWPYPRQLAHRGGGTLAPENTLAGMRCATAYGFRGVEFDVMLSRDGVPVLMHDPQFGRTIHAPGGVTDYTADALGMLDAGAWLGPQFRGEPVCTLAQVLAHCSAHGLWMNIEIKPSSDAVAAETGTVVAAATKAFFAQHYGNAAAAANRAADDTPLPLFSSFSIDALHAAQTAAPGIPRGWLVDKIAAGWQAQLEALEAVSLHTSHRRLDAASAAAVRHAGYGLMCYTVNDPQRAQLLTQWGVDAYCTDRLDLFAPAPYCG